MAYALLDTVDQHSLQRRSEASDNGVVTVFACAEDSTTLFYGWRFDHE
jgi:hypothetical protein